ncbi:helix-turn-helix transcriptional regulator [Paenibacillus sp. GCM10027626]|uniref:helix-turn-helix transcriptional regulator n=1 Tax=Paenibacillus sp. GCM10027626 TaxID=3273411 RepID=UPI00363F47BB
MGTFKELAPGRDAEGAGKSTKQTILTLLKTKGKMNAGELASELNITEMGVRRHLGVLERQGYIELEVVRQPMGRPTHRYGLTDAAEHLFPKNYHLLALDFLQELNKDPQSALLIDRLFAGRKRKLLERFAERMQGKNLADKVKELAVIQNEGGYMVKVEQGTDSILLHEFNCPIAQVANQFDQACRCELNLFEELLDTSVERTECLASGGGKCTYKIDTDKE